MCLNAAQQQERAGRSAAPEADPSSSDSVISGSDSSSSKGCASSSAGGREPQATPAVAGAAGGSRGPPRYPDFTFPIPLLLEALEAHAVLGYAPSGLMLQALMPSVCRQLGGAAPAEALRLLDMLALAQHNPGPAVLGLLVARAGEGGPAGAEAGAALAAELEGVRVP